MLEEETCNTTTRNARRLLRVKRAPRGLRAKLSTMLCKNNAEIAANLPAADMGEGSRVGVHSETKTQNGMGAYYRKQENKQIEL